MSTLSASEDGSTDTSEVTKTPSGIPIDYAFSKAASEEMIQRAAEALRKLRRRPRQELAAGGYGECIECAGIAARSGRIEQL